MKLFNCYFYVDNGATYFKDKCCIIAEDKKEAEEIFIRWFYDHASTCSDYDHLVIEEELLPNKVIYTGSHYMW